MGGIDTRNFSHANAGVVTGPPYGPNIPGASYYPEITRDQLRGRGSPAADANPDEPSSSYYRPLDVKDEWDWRSIGITLGIFLAVIVVIFAVIFVIPFNHQSFSGLAGALDPDQTVTIPGGASVHGNWQSVSGYPVTFQIYREYDGALVYNVTAASGGFSFNSPVTSDYEFTTTAGAATFSGAYQAPLLSIPHIVT
jgi:hypothetical protein